MKEVFLTIRMTKKFKAALAKEATKDSRPLSSLALKILEEWLSRRKQ